MKDILGLPQTVIYGNSLADWVIAFSVAILVVLLLLIARQFIVARHGRYLQSGRVAPVRLIAHLAGETRQFFLIPFAVYVGERWLTLDARVERASSYAMLLLVLTQVGIWATRTITFLMAEREARELGRAGDSGIKSSLTIIAFAGRIIVWSIVLPVALDKPFVIGDSLEIGEHSGVVERIGIKSLRLRSGSGEQIILANADALKSRVRNFGRAVERRAIFSIGVQYETPAEKLALIPKLVAEAVAPERRARLERCHLRQFGDFALIYEISLYSLDPTLEVLLDRQHAISLRIIETFRRNGIEFAYPAQRVIGPPAN